MEEHADSCIKTMKLYTHVERSKSLHIIDDCIPNVSCSKTIIFAVKTELTARGMLRSDSIDPIALSEIDSMHYEGNNAIEDAVAAMKLTSSSTVLDIGAGFGGISRVLSSISKCNSTEFELQPDISEMAEYLTNKCNLDNLVKHELGDIITIDLDKLGSGKSSYDGIVSFLVFLHIPDKSSLLKNCAAMLKSGGTIFIEDYYCKSPFSDSEIKSLAEDVYSKDLPTKEEYISHLKACGFDNIQFIDKTSEWTAYVNERVGAFIANRQHFENLHGEACYLGLLHFYEAVAKLFNGHNLGGVRIIAEKA